MVLPCLAVRIRFLCLILKSLIINSSKRHLPLCIMLMLSDVWEVKNGFALPHFCANTLGRKGGSLAQDPVKSILLSSTSFADVLANTYPELPPRFVIN